MRILAGSIRRLPISGACLILGTVLTLSVVASCSSGGIEPAPEAEEQDLGTAALAESLTFHASFDNGPDADFASGDRAIYSAPSFDEVDQARLGISVPAVEIVSGAGRFGDALRFGKKNTQALFYKAKDNVAYSGSDIAGTVSFWLSLDPAVDLEPGYCDPIQVTDAAYNDAAVWVDFTDKNPRKFRLGVFGNLEEWNPEKLPPDKNPDFEKRLVAVDEPPFRRGQWNQVVVTYFGLNSDVGGVAKLYLDGELQGTAEGISELFTWDAEEAALRLGVNYVGLFDDLAVFDRALTGEEVVALHQLADGVKSLRQ